MPEEPFGQAEPLPAAVAVLVHPVNPQEHPTYQGAWRWAVMIGNRPPADLDHCVQAGVAATEPEASAAGEQIGAAVATALRRYALAATYEYRRLGWDPIPAEADERPVLVWRGEDT